MLISTLFSIFLRLLNVEKMYWIATSLNTGNFRMSSECKCWNISCFIYICNTLWFFLRPYVVCLRSWSLQGALYILKCRQLQHFQAFFLFLQKGRVLILIGHRSILQTRLYWSIQVLQLLTGCVEAYFQ